MGSLAPEMDAWLRGEGVVVTASDRAARALTAAFHRARQAEGLQAWIAPRILNWNSFTRAAWEDRRQDGRLLLNPTQEMALWADIASRGRHLATMLEGPRHRLAEMAMEAHGLLCRYAPKCLEKRSAWQQDAGVFSGWVGDFDQACRDGDLLSTNRLALETIPLLIAKSAQRPPLLLAGFDRILPVQRSFFDAWGPWHQAELGARASEIRFHCAGDTQAELNACARWCRSRLNADPNARLLVVTQDAATQRGGIERAFLAHTGAAGPLQLEFSLGIPLNRVALARGAYLLLRWLTGPIEEQELDWLISSGQTALSAEETLALHATMRWLRDRGRQRTQWTIEAFLSQGRAAPVQWAARMRRARANLAEEQHRPKSPLDWAAMIPPLLQTAGWPGASPLSSIEFQALHRWEQALDDTASLGFDGRRVEWRKFMFALASNLEQTLFSPETQDAPIQIAGAAESAGLTADGIWFLGASEDAWPARAAAHPLLPPDVQREAAMPHATAQIDLDLARAVTVRLLASAPEVHFSYARHGENSELRPSRLALEFAGQQEPLPKPAPLAEPMTVNFEDWSRIPFPPGKAGGGASVLTSQSQCPFKAFATTRLGARGWEPAQAGLTPSQRGQLLHDVLHAVWAGPPRGIRSHTELLNLADRAAFVAGHVGEVFTNKMPSAVTDRMPWRYLRLEQQRLTRLITEWLEYEATRWPFEVAATEADRSVEIAGLALKLRIDRVDRLNDGTLLVVDYKTGNPAPTAWELPRPNDVQLPLYAGFALDKEAELGGLVYARVRIGEQCFAGRVGDAKDTLLPNLGNTTSLVKNPLAAEMLIDWREAIEQLARDFLAGRAEVDPQEYPDTCKHCDLQSLCRIQEHQPLIDGEEASQGEEVDDE